MMAKMNVGKWRAKFVSDFKTKEFMPIKVLFFLTFGAQVSMIPFLTLQARSLGITEEEVGIIYSFIPIASLVAPALSGMLADKIGNFRVLLSGATALCGLSALLFLLVPPGRIMHKMPNELPLEISCSSGFGAQLSVAPPYMCEPAIIFESFPVKFQQCTVTCYLSKEEQDEIHVNITDPNLTCLNSEDCLATSGNPGNNITFFNNTGINAATSETSKYDASVMITRHNDTFGIDTFRSDEPLCPNVGKKFNQGDNCVTICKATTIREQMCINDIAVQELDPTLTFYSHLFIRLFKEFTIATSMPLFEGAAVTILKQHGGDFGFQRLYSNIGMMIMTPISGTLIDMVSAGKVIDDFRPAMYMYCGLKLMAAFIILFLNMEFKKSSTRVVSDFSSMMLNPEIIVFLIATLLAGTCYGYIETFLFWLLEDLGADKQLMGLTLTVGCVFGIPVLMVSAFIMKRIGHVNTIVLGFFIYIIRLLGYTFIPSPWWAMPFEALECFTVSLMVVSFVSYAAVLSTPSTVVTLQGMYGGLYNGVGRGAGSLIGGFLIERIGIFQTFRVMAAIGGSSGLLYFIVNFIFFRNRRKVEIAEGGIPKNKTFEEFSFSEAPTPEMVKSQFCKNDKNIEEFSNSEAPSPDTLKSVRRSLTIESIGQDGPTPELLKKVRRSLTIESIAQERDNRAFEGENIV